MAGIDKAVVSDVVDLVNTYHKALGIDATAAEKTTAMHLHLLMEQNRLLAEISGKLSKMVGAA